MASVLMTLAASPPPVFSMTSLVSPVWPTSVAHRIQAALVNPAPSPVLTSSPIPGLGTCPRSHLTLSSCPSAPVRVLCVLPGPFPLLFPSLPWGPFTFQGCQAVMNCFRGSSPLSECRSRSLLRGPECSRQLSSFCLLVRFSLV